MIILGLTGSIGMGESTAASVLRQLGVPVHDADASNHLLTGPGGAAVGFVEAAFPGTTRNGAIDRKELGKRVFGNASELRRLETILHPLIRVEEQIFLRTCRRLRRPIAVLDIPLLYETGGEKRCDAVIVVTAPQFLQDQRVLKRPGMSRKRLQEIRGQQMPDAEKRQRADFIVTGLGKCASRTALTHILNKLETPVIGVFDSGYGGLTVLAALHARLPRQRFLYLGDNANAPYGPKAGPEIQALTQAGVARLFHYGARLVILACNTATAAAIRPMQQQWLPTHYPGRRVLGVIAPMVEEIAQTPWYSKAGPDEARRPVETVAVFATQATVESGFYPTEIALRAPNIAVIQQACPDLAGMIEAGAPEAALRETVGRHVGQLLKPLGEAPDKAVLGCTHFPLVESLFRAALPAETQILSQPARVAAALVAYLFRHPEMKNFASAAVEPLCLTTGDPDAVSALASRFYGRHLRFEGVDSAPRSSAETLLDA